jgi:hypothetical protein
MPSNFFSGRRLFMTSCQLRIATVNDSHTVEAVSTQVRHATGLAVQPVFQEIDRRELIVELILNSVGSHSPGELARRIQSSAPNLEVLAGWHPLEPPVSSRPPRPDQLFFSDDVSVPPLARRAFDDLVATAGWQPTAGPDNSHWLLAVPVVGGDGRMVAALARRDGHYHRFSARDAATLRDTLAA